MPQEHKGKTFYSNKYGFFEQNARNIPDYLLNNSKYRAGISPKFDESEKANSVCSG
jgi:hypothetical protein